MSAKITLTIDGQTLQANKGESLLSLAKRHDIFIAHLCSGYHRHNPADGNCRLCLVEIDGEAPLVPVCKRIAGEGMVVHTNSPRADQSRKMIMELLIADQPPRPQSPDPNSPFWQMADKIGISHSRFSKRNDQPSPDFSHPALAVNLEACIHCTNCIRACRTLQGNDVLGMAWRGAKSQIIFDQNDIVKDSSCVACGECVQSCPTGALLPRDPETKIPQPHTLTDKSVDSLCPFCGVGCQMTYHLSPDHSRIIKVEGRNGPANQERLCVKGRFGFDYVRHPHRLTQPWVRKDNIPKRFDDVIDPAHPESHFRPASWDEALDRAAQGFLNIKHSHGSHALAGFGSAKGSNEEAYLFQKLIRSGFGTNNVDHCTRLCHASSVAALIEGIGSGAVTAPFSDALKSDLIILIGCRPTQNHPVAANFIKQAKAQGSKLVIMDPRRQSLSRLADYHLQFSPGADVALLNAIMHVLIEEDLIDHDYLDQHCDGFDDFSRHLKDFSPEKMEPLCGIKAQTIREVARLYGNSDKAMIFWGMGVSQHVHGTDNARCLIALALLRGNIGREGTGLHPLRGQNNVQGASDAGLIPMFYPDYKSVEDSAIRNHYEQIWQTPLPQMRGLSVVEIIDGAHRGDIRGLYIMGENPAMSDPDLNHARQGLAALDHLVVQDIFMTETAFHADVIFPASAFVEKDGSFTNSNRQIQIGRKVLDLPGSARPDLEIIIDLAKRLGLNWSYQGPKDVFNEMRLSMKSLTGISWERLDQENAVTYPCDDENHPGHSIMFADRFPTLTGKARLVPSQIIPPDELPDQDYPLTLTTGRMLEHWHTGAMTRRADVLNRLEPTPVASLHPHQLADLGLKANDQALITSRRGEIVISLRSDRDVPYGMVFIPFCYAEAAANLLTNPKLDPFGKIPEFKLCAVKVTPHINKTT